MAKCMGCNKTAFLTKRFDNIVLCHNCANLIEFSSWKDRIFNSMEELVERKKQIIQLANTNGMKKEIIESIEKYFNEYIDNGFVTAVNGKAGQVLKVFSDFCIVNTKNESAKISLENMFYQFDDDDDDDDDDEKISLNDKQKLVQGLMSGKIIQTGIGVAMSASLKEQEKEKRQEKREREREKKLERIIKVGDRKIYYKNICDVETFSKSNTANGYLKFVPNGVNINDLYACEYFFFNNSRPFESKKIKKDVESICDTLSEKISKLKTEIVKEQEQIIKTTTEEKPQTEVKQEDKGIDSFEQIRKYKQLLDEGIITEEEFNIKKKELLNL